MSSLGKCLFNVTALLDRSHSHIGPQVRVDDRHIFVGGVNWVYDRDERLIVHGHQFGTVPSQVRVFGHHHRYRLANVTHFVLGQDRMFRRVEFVHRTIAHGSDWQVR